MSDVTCCGDCKRMRRLITKSGRKYGLQQDGKDPLALCSRAMEYVTAGKPACRKAE
jgi:hypothetical protein